MATWPGTIATATPGGVGASADFDNHAAALNTIGGAWATYTPALTAGTDPTLGSSSISGTYRLLGKTVDVHIEFTAGAGYSAGSGVYRFSLPSGCAPANAGVNSALGTAIVLDASTATYVAGVYYVSPTVVSVEMAATSTPLSHNSPIATWATGDRVSIHIPSMQIL